jgi:hypothetical protein
MKTTIGEVMTMVAGKVDPKKASLDELRQFLGDVIQYNPQSKELWDLLTSLRGPDSPSETSTMSPSEASKAYDARRKRKHLTVEVIRGRAFNGIVGGAARFRTDIDFVTLPPRKEWDHFDKHVERAALVLGLGIKIEGEEKKEGWAVPVTAAAAAPKVKWKTSSPTTTPSLQSLLNYGTLEELQYAVAQKMNGLEKAEKILSTYTKAGTHVLMEHYSMVAGQYSDSIAKLKAKIAEKQKQTTLYDAPTPVNISGGMNTPVAKYIVGNLKTYNLYNQQVTWTPIEKEKDAKNDDIPF